MTDNTRLEMLRLITGVEDYLASVEKAGKVEKGKIRDAVMDIPQSVHLPAEAGQVQMWAKAEWHAQSALAAIRTQLAGDELGFDSILADMAIAKFRVTQLYLLVQQSRIKFNAASQHDLSLRNIDMMRKAIDDAAKAKAAEENRGFWGKLSNILGVAVAAIGVLLAPFTGGLSLLATGYLVVDLGLQLGEQISGVKMSIDSGLQIAFKFVLDNMPLNGLPESQREFIAGIASAVTSLVIAVGMTVLSAGGGAPKLFGAVSKLSQKIAAVMPKASIAIQGTAHLASSGTGMASGKFGLDNAYAEYDRNDVEAQRTDIKGDQQSLLKEFQQFNEDMKRAMEQLERDISQAANSLSRFFDGNSRIIGSLSGNRYAA
jgi:hypothetical protein